MKLINRRALVVTGTSALAGCALLAAPGAGLPALPAARSGPYLLGAGDAVDVRIFGETQLSGAYQVDDSGIVDISLLGPVAAGGLGTDGLAKAIAADLRAKNLILAPHVAVEVTGFRPFYILGEVNHPGQYPYRPGMTVLTAISIAGGFTYRAVQDYAGVTRDGGGGPAQYRADSFAAVAPGDVVTVFERRF